MISVVVPVLNEQQALPVFLENAARWEGSFELIFSDGGSTDATLALLTGQNVVSGSAGRGAQLRRGAEAATGEIFLFLHVDSIIGPGVLGHIEQAVADGALWGCLRMRFDEAGATYRIGAGMSNLRVVATGIPFGDQGIFATREFYERIGGFPDIALMEDYEFSRRARKAAGRPVRLPDVIETSARRFEKAGALRTAWEMRKLRYLFRRGVPADRLAAHYPQVREGNRGRDCGSSTTVLVVLTRTPVPGLVKTRMQSALSADECAALQRALALDTIEQACTVPGVNPVVYCSDDWKYSEHGQRIRECFEEDIKRTGEACGVRVVVKQQRGADLGERISSAVRDELADGAERCVVMGSDLPRITSAIIAETLSAWGDADVLLAPSGDGGYWAVGLKRPFPQLFKGAHMGTSSVWDEALETCREQGMDVTFGQAADDLDTPCDLSRLLVDFESGGVLPHARMADFLQEQKSIMRP